MGDVEPMPKTGSTTEMSILRTTILVRFVSACLILQFLMEVLEVEAGDGRFHENNKAYCDSLVAQNLVAQN